MKKLIIAAACLIMAGCGLNNGGYVLPGTEKEVFPVVDKYLICAADGDWEAVYETLSGEALVEAKANSGRFKEREKIISQDFILITVCSDIVEVSADFTKSTGAGFDRLAYKFRLMRSGDRWRIYKTTPGEYHHGLLKSGQAPLEAVEMIIKYMELPLAEKQAGDNRYLAGRLLKESRKARLLPVDTGWAKEQEKNSVRVRDLECLGISDGYAVARVNYQIHRDGSVSPAQAIVEVINVNGEWKICRMDFS